MLVGLLSRRASATQANPATARLAGVEESVPVPGLAENSLFIALAKLLWSYEITAKKGVTYDIFDYTDGFNVRPKPFQCEIKVRSQQHRQVLEKEYREATEFMAKFPLFKENEIVV